MTAQEPKCPCCAVVEAENMVLRALLEDEREANLTLQRKIALIAAAQIHIPDTADVH